MDIDLDIRHYEPEDLEAFLDLPHLYDEDDLHEKVMERYQQVYAATDDRTFHRQFRCFLDAARDQLGSLLRNESPTMVSTSTSASASAPVDNTNPPTITPPTSHPLVDKPLLPFIFADNSQYFAVEGKINPIEKHLNTIMLSIDSAFRTNPATSTSTDFIYQLPVPLKNIVSLQMSAMEFPRMFYEFSSKLNNNSFHISLHNMEGTTITDASYTITLPDGNYSSDVFQTTMNNYFVNLGIDFLVCDIDGITSKTIIRAVDPIDIVKNPTWLKKMPYESTMNAYIEQSTGVSYVQSTTPNLSYSPHFYFILDFTNSENKSLMENLGWMMGYRKGKYRFDSTHTYTNYIINPSHKFPIVFKAYGVSESSFGSNYTNYIYLEVDDFHNNSQTNTLYGNTGTNSYISNNLLARISLNNVPYTILEKHGGDNIAKKREYYGPIRLEKLRIRLLNRFGKVIDMNGNDYSFLIELQQIYS
jgi:hypothetical protein